MHLRAALPLGHSSILRNDLCHLQAVMIQAQFHQRFQTRHCGVGSGTHRAKGGRKLPQLDLD